MDDKKPQLIVVAGCNGSGKSTYSALLAPEDTVPFDYDRIFLEIYKSKPDWELKELMVHNEAFEKLQSSVENSIKHKRRFCYETNFHSEPMHWPDIFRQNGYELVIFFFCLDSVEEAKRRVLIRYQNGGHFVPDNEVEERFYLGYRCLDKYFTKFDSIYLLDSSAYNQTPKHVLTIRKGQVVFRKNYPAYLVNELPALNAVL